MIVSGPRSYYEEYARKKDTDRAFAKPPALLTDRNAYINFLEVQLERVSAACFAVQAYEERFHDMQSLIVSLDERCASTAKLVALAQQCTEEVRSEAHQRAELESHANRSIRTELQKSMQAMAIKVDYLEQNLSTFPRLEGRLTAMDKRITEVDANQREIDLENRVAQQASDARISQLETVKNEIFALLESNRSSVSRIAFDVEENNTRVNNYINTVEARISESLEISRDTMRQELNGTQTKCSMQVDELRRLLEANGAESSANSVKLYKSLKDDIAGCCTTWEKNCEILAVDAKADCDRRMGKLQQTIAQSVDELRTAQNKQAGFMCELEESFSAQLEALQAGLHSVSREHRSRHSAQLDRHKALDAQVQELRSSVESASRAASYSWVGQQQQQQQQPGTPGGGVLGPENQSFGGQSFEAPGGPMSPIPRTLDGSFFMPAPVHGAGTGGAVAMSASMFGGVYQPGYNTGQHAASVMYPAQATSPGQYRAQGQASNDRSMVDLTQSSKYGRSRNGVTRAHSPQAASAGAVSAGAGAAARSSVNKGKEPGEAAVDIVQKFLQIYEADQREVSKRLDQLGAAKAPRSNSAIRRRLRTAAAAVKRQSQSMHPPMQDKRSRSTSPSAGAPRSSGGDGVELDKERTKQKGKEKTPGEVLSRFFLDYKKDRKVLMERMASLEQHAIKPEAAAESTDNTRFDPLDTARSALSANAQAFWNNATEPSSSRPGDSESVGENEATPSKQHESAEEQESRESPASSSTDPAGEAIEALLSRSMNDFMRTNRDRRPAGDTSSARSIEGSRAGGRDQTASPQRLSRTTSLFDAVHRESANKRYMQFTESLSLSRAQSPLDAAAMEWINEPATQRPVWKVNTFRSPDRPRGSEKTVSSLPSSRGASTSPGARTAATLIDRLVKQDRSALFSKVHGATKCGDRALRASSDGLPEHAASTVNAPAPPAQETDSASVSSSSKESSSASRLW